MKNRSVPVDTVLPHIVYKNLPAAIEWLNKAFGFREHYRYGEPNGAQMHLDNAYIMVRSARPGDATAKPGAEQTASLTVFVQDVDAHFRQSKAAGAKIVEELHEVMYGEKQYGVGPRRASLAFFAACSRCEPGGVGREGRRAVRVSSWSM
jgi:uncharacterized glyoxalase superfamily protein PhnB